jgi:hypothetical protein
MSFECIKKPKNIIQNVFKKTFLTTRAQPPPPQFFLPVRTWTLFYTGNKLIQKQMLTKLMYSLYEINEEWYHGCSEMSEAYVCILKAHSHTLKEWRFNLSTSRVSVQFLNSLRVSSRIVRCNTNPPTIQKLHWHSRGAQIEPPLFKCDSEWAFRIQVLNQWFYLISALLTGGI